MATGFVPKGFVERWLIQKRSIATTSVELETGWPWWKCAAQLLSKSKKKKRKKETEKKQSSIKKKLHISNHE